jgi:putative transposase
VRKLLKRSSFCSLEDLKERILRFIDYFNLTMAKPIDWLHSSRPLFGMSTTG